MELLAFTEHKERVWQAEWSPDGKVVATTGSDGSAKIWDPETGQVIRDLYPEDFQLTVIGLGWSPDGTRIATFAGDGVGRIWDIATGEELVTFSGHSGPVLDIVWARSGGRIVTEGTDGTARVWDANTGAEILRYDVPGGAAAAWSPDEKRIALTSSDGSLQVFPAWQTTQELIDYAHQCCIIRELTDSERELFGLPPR
jgi:WD40 repeat protein